MTRLEPTPLASPIVLPGSGDLPVVLSVPHSGRDYPDWLVAMSLRGRPSLTILEDPLVDRLLWRALQHGVAAVIARSPRAAIDCNRAEDEIDPAIVEGRVPARISARARGGLGIVPSRTQAHGHLWRRAISRAELAERIAQAHRPYHDALARELRRTVERFGCALLLDCHSMPPVPDGVPPVIFGDCFGRTAGQWASQEAARIAARAGFASALNNPFAGGHVIERHAAPARGVHALQVEIDRRCYLDARLREPGEGFDRVALLFERLTSGLGQALLDGATRIAAE